MNALRISWVRAIWCRQFAGADGDFYLKDWHAERVKATSLLRAWTPPPPQEEFP